MLLKAFLKHEILNLLKSKRVYLTVIMFLLLFISVFAVRVVDYQKQINQYLADVRQAEEALQKENLVNYSFINPRAIHQPLIFSIYNQGFKFNRVIDIEFYEPIDRTITLNEERNRIYKENTQLDITFLITFFLSLFILLISYDSVNGEKRTGTLRILMTFPIKRQSFILKKILGVFIFVAFTFTIPYFMSILTLVFIYSNLLASSFFLSAFFYWFLVILFIFFFSLLGILISVCTTAPNRSLVYSLLVWILLSIVLPISWDYIISPTLYKDKLDQLTQIHTDKQTQANDIFSNPPPEARTGGSYSNYSGGPLYNFHFFSSLDTYKSHYNFQKYICDNYYPATREVEMANDDVLRKRISIENTKSLVFFFDPIVLFKDISMKISGNSIADYQRFLQDGRGIRDDLVSIGIKEEWLLDYRFFAYYADERLSESDRYIALIKRLQTEEWEDVESDYYAFSDNAERFSFDLPFFRRYNQPNPTFGEIFSRIAMVLCIFVVSIVLLWILTWYKFMRYDVR